MVDQTRYVQPPLVLVSKIYNDGKCISHNVVSNKIIVLRKGFVKYKTSKTIIIDSDSQQIKDLIKY